MIAITIIITISFIDMLLIFPEPIVYLRFRYGVNCDRPLVHEHVYERYEEVPLQPVLVQVGGSPVGRRYDH